uniref:SWIM-type domain-containing protein n=1 Tax=Trichuris muris TaxID=70415 RepID=A0A5S6Q2K3_TRIMR
MSTYTPTPTNDENQTEKSGVDLYAGQSETSRIVQRLRTCGFGPRTSRFVPCESPLVVATGGESAFGIIGNVLCSHSTSMDIEEQMTLEDWERCDDGSPCSFTSDVGSSCANFRGWEEPSENGYDYRNAGNFRRVLPLLDIAAKAVAKSIPFEMVERFKPPVPEMLQQRIAFFSFPEKVADIRLYCCLGNGSVEEYAKGKALYIGKAVREIIQIGFHLSAVVQMVPGIFKQTNSASPTLSKGFATVGFDKTRYHVAITLDRQRVTSCTCSCGQLWCQHCVAACLYRIKEAERVPLRAPVSELLSQLNRGQLQKFAQNLITLLPRQVIPIAQNLLDELLNKKAKINSECGAPDPTAGAAVGDVHSWCMQDRTLKDMVHKILVKYCIPSPLVYSDVNYLSSSSPAVSTEFQGLLRPFRGREPEGLWNLLFIVREMIRRRDNNAIRLLHIVTAGCVANAQVLEWWYRTKVVDVAFRSSISSFCESLKNMCVDVNHATVKTKMNPNSQLFAAKYSCSLLMDEIVRLWRLVALNPVMSNRERRTLAYNLSQFQSAVEITLKDTIMRSAALEEREEQQPSTSTELTVESFAETYLRNFSGFKEAYEMCLFDWSTVDTGDFRFGNGKQSSTLPKQYCVTARHGSFHAISEHEKEVAWVSNGTRCIDADLRSRTGWTGLLDNQKPLYPTVKGSSNIRVVKGQLCLSLSDLECETPSSGVSPCVYNPEITADEEDDAKSCSSDVAENRGGANVGDVGWSSVTAASNGNGTCASSTLDKETWTIEGSSFANVPPPNDPRKIRFAICEALYAHGYVNLARKMAIEIAEDMVNNKRNLCFELPAAPSGHKESWQPSRISSGRKKKRAFDSQQDVDPKALELTESVCEALSSGCFLLDVLAKNGSHHSIAFHVGLLILTLPRSAAASKFLEAKIFFLETDVLNKMKAMTEALAKEEMEAIRECARDLIGKTKERRWTGAMPMTLAVYLAHVLLLNKDGNVFRASSDEQLGFEVALAGLSMKTELSEDDHPLLYECVRRFRGELSLELFIYFKDDNEKLAKILDTLLDIEMHQMHHSPRETNVFHFGKVGESNSSGTSHAPEGNASSAEPEVVLHFRFKSCCEIAADTNYVEEEIIDGKRFVCDGVTSTTFEDLESTPCEMSSAVAWPHSGVGPMNRRITCICEADNLRRINQLTRERRLFNKAKEEFSNNQQMTVIGGGGGGGACTGYEERKSGFLPSESHVHFMMELSKRLSTEAGGNHTTAIFTTPDGIASHVRVAHRALHLCSFQVGLYALGLHNKLSKNWQSRTYSSFVSWISGQAVDIGRSALNILMDTWENHMTPSEVAALADNASQSRDPSLVEAAAQLALSVLPHAHVLNSSEIQRAVSQCKEQSMKMLESACLAVEKAGKSYGVCPEVLFQISFQWFEVYKDAVGFGSNGSNARSSNSNAETADARSRSDSFDYNYQRRLVNVQGMVQLPLMIEPPNHEPPAPARWNAAKQAVPCRDVMQQYFTDPRMNTIGQPMFTISAPVSMPIGYNPFNGQPPPAPVPPPNSITPTPFCTYGGQASAAQSHLWRPTENTYNNIHFATSPAVCLPPVYSGTDYGYAPFYEQVQYPPAVFSFRCVATQTNEANAILEHVSSEDHAVAACYLQNAYRVGMLAMETLGRRISNERSSTKFSQNPSYSDDVKLLLAFAKKLGLSWVLNFASVAASSVHSPFILLHLFFDVVQYIARTTGSTPGGVPPNLQNSITTVEAIIC